MKKFCLISAAFLLFASATMTAQPQRQAEVIPGRTPVSPSIDLYFTPATDAAVAPDDQGFIRRWLLLEPIPKPNRSNTVFVDSYLRDVFGKEYFKDQLSQTVLPKDGQKVKMEVDVTPEAPMFLMPGQEPPVIEPKFEKRTLKWHALDSKNFNVKLFRFASGLQTEVYGVLFWAVTVIDCPEEIKDVRLSVGSNSASMWWVNGEEALILSSDRRMVADDAMSRRLTLKKGRNIIWGSVINGPGMSDMCVRFVNEQGEPVTSFTVNTK